jgi:hypothetical protein
LLVSSYRQQMSSWLLNIKTKALFGTTRAAAE